MSVIHAQPVKACATVLFLDLEMLKRFGARSFGRQPCNHPEFQKLALFPLPIVICVQAAKSSMSISSHGVCVPTQALCGEAHSCQSQRSLSALANRSILRMPKPRFCFGNLVLIQLTFHLPLVRDASPAQRKRFLNLSKSSRSSFDVLVTVRRYTGCEESTVLVRHARPA